MIQEKTERPMREDRFQRLEPSALSTAEKGSLIKLALTVLAERHRPGRALGSPEETRAFLRLKLGDRKSEVFGVIFLTNRHRVIRVVELFQGSVAGAAVHPRIVVQWALELNAVATVFFHNHPSGIAEPSHADEAITRRLKDALSLVDVRVLDHFVVTAGESVSFAETGRL